MDENMKKKEWIIVLIITTAIVIFAIIELSKTITQVFD